MRRTSITKRLFVYILCVVLGISLLILLSNTLLLRPLYYASIRSTMLRAADMLSDIDYGIDDEEWLYELSTLTAGASYDVIIRTDDEVLFSSSREIGLMPRPGYGIQPEQGEPENPSRFFRPPSVGFPLIQRGANEIEKVSENTYFGVIVEDRTQIEMLVCTRTLDSGITLFLTQAVEPINQSVQQANILLIACALLALLLSSVFVFKVSKRFTRPIREIKSTVGALASLNFDLTCDIRTGDELQSLGEDVNKLGQELKNALDTLRMQNQQLEKDIIAQRQFISNASHELRTPLALIKGYADEINTGFAKGAEQNYIEIIAEESAKMSRLLTEMLELSRLESGRSEMYAQRQRVGDCIRNFLDKYEGFIDHNQLHISLDIEEDAMGVFDAMRFEQVLANYISNAARYGDQQKKVRISAKTKGDAVRISVFNTGRHIPDEIAAHIWDGFYKADSARTRIAESYGLGLSIVKAIQMAAGQKFGVKNVEYGVEFWFDVLKNGNDSDM